MIQFSEAVVNARLRALQAQFIEAGIAHIQLHLGPVVADTTTPVTNANGPITGQWMLPSTATHVGFWPKATVNPVGGALDLDLFHLPTFQLSSSSNERTALPGFFRYKPFGGGPILMQGTISEPGGGGDLILAPNGRVQGSANYRFIQFRLDESHLIG